jgi:hypothetical protein
VISQFYTMTIACGAAAPVRNLITPMATLC